MREVFNRLDYYHTFFKDVQERVVPKESTQNLSNEEIDAMKTIRDNRLKVYRRLFVNSILKIYKEDYANVSDVKSGETKAMKKRRLDVEAAAKSPAKGLLDLEAIESDYDSDKPKGGKHISVQRSVKKIVVEEEEDEPNHGDTMDTVEQSQQVTRNYVKKFGLNPIRKDTRVNITRAITKDVDAESVTDGANAIHKKRSDAIDEENNTGEVGTNLQSFSMYPGDICIPMEPIVSKIKLLYRR
jgi:hypothetical protein